MDNELASDFGMALPTQPGRWLAWSSLGFALLQSVCMAIVAVSGIRTAIGLTSLLVAGGVYPVVLKFHADTIRVPMMVFAIAGSLLNLVVLWQIHRTRNRPSAAWRRAPVAFRKVRFERAQFTLSIITLVLVGLESFLHHALQH